MTEQIWRENYQRVFRFVRSRVRDEAATADLVQEVFLKAYTHLDRLQDPERLQSWLMSIAQRSIVDRYRRAGQSAEPLADADEATWPIDQVLDDYYDHPRMPACVAYMLEQLPEQHRRVIELAELHRMSQRAMAEELGIPYSTLKSRVQRARQRLRDTFLECCLVEADRYGNLLRVQPKSDSRARRHQAAIGQVCRDWEEQTPQASRTTR